MFVAAVTWSPYCRATVPRAIEPIQAANHHQELLTGGGDGVFAGRHGGTFDAGAARAVRQVTAVRPTARSGRAAVRSPVSASPTSAGWASARSPPACSPTSAPRSSRSRTASASTRPRRLPIYKGEPARNFGEEEIDPDPNKGGLFNNYCRNKLGVTINMRTPSGPRAGRAADRAQRSVVSENFAPGVMERWGLTYERLQRAVARGDLRPDERLRPHAARTPSTAATAPSCRR